MAALSDTGAPDAPEVGAAGLSGLSAAREWPVVPSPTTNIRVALLESESQSGSELKSGRLIVNDPSNLPVYVHCQGGRHRTGAMTAVYRLTHDKWTADQAYGEMKKYGFETFIGHPQLKTFVYDYYQKMTAAAPGR